MFEYSATTSNATNTITATPAEGLGVFVSVNGAEHENGTPATWVVGLNEVFITLTLESDPEFVSPSYVVNVTKSGTLQSLTVASVAGENTGDTAVSITEPRTTGTSYFYKTAASVVLPALDDELEGWTAWDRLADITATTGDEIAVVEVLTLGNVDYVKSAGKTTVVSKSE